MAGKGKKKAKKSTGKKSKAAKKKMAKLSTRPKSAVKAKAKAQKKPKPKPKPKPRVKSKKPKTKSKPPSKPKKKLKAKPAPKKKAKTVILPSPKPSPKRSGSRQTPARGKARVGIIMGSESDRFVMEDAARMLGDLGIRFEITISSAHRNPEDTREYARDASRKGYRVIIAGAGGAAHLAGVIAAETTLPVVAVPMDTSPLHGLDSFLSTFQMPSGVPVATMGIGRSGAKNAAILAAEILALHDSDLDKRLKELKRKMAEDRRMAGQAVKAEASRLA